MAITSMLEAVSAELPWDLVLTYARMPRWKPDDVARGGHEIVSRLEAHGVPVTVHEPSLYLSIPHTAEVRSAAGTFRAPTLFMSFTDDAFAPESSVLALRHQLVRAPITHRRIDPREVGERKLGHFGFFKKARANDLWEEAFDFFDGALRGERPGTTIARPMFTEREIMADLQYGRA